MIQIFEMDAYNWSTSPTVGTVPSGKFSREFISVENILFPFIETFVIIIFINIFLIVIVSIFTLFFLALE